MAGMAYQRVYNVFNWDRIAKQTAQVYNRVWSEYQSSSFAQTADQPPKEIKAVKAAKIAKVTKER
jgi:hypothetical protein